MNVSNDSRIGAAFTRHQAGDLAEAERQYRAVLAADPDNLNCLHLLGVLKTGIGKAAEAVPLLERALGILRWTAGETAQHAALYNNLAIALNASGRFADAEQACRRGLRLDARLPELHVTLGAALLAQGRFAEACA